MVYIFKNRRRLDRNKKRRALSPVQTDAILLTNNFQHCWMLHDVSICTTCYMSLYAVGSRCAKFETGQTFNYVETNVTTPNIVGPTMLGVVASVCT